MPSTETVTDHGAVGDGETPDTKAIQSAVDAAADAGGGTVSVPPGTYRTGTVFLADDVTLAVGAGATLLGSTDPAAYDAGSGPLNAMLVANGCENVAVVGDGTLHANGTAFMRMDTPLDPGADPATEGADYRPRQAAATRFLRTESVRDGPVTPAEFRPDRTLVCYDSEQIRIEGITIREAPHWTVHFLGCRGVTVRGVDIRNEVLVPNSDGINPEHTSDVTISDCHIHTGDDAISPKANDDYDVGGPTENVTVTNCTLVSRSCAVKFGSGTVADMRDHTYSNLVIRDSNRGLGIQHRGPGDIENVLFSNIVVETRLFTGNWWGQAEPIHVSSLPRDPGGRLGTVRGLRFSDIRARGEGGVVLWGTAGSLRDVTVDGLSLAVRSSELAERRGGNRDLRPTATRPAIEAAEVPAVHARGVDGLTLRELDVEWPASPASYRGSGVACERSDRVEIDGFQGRGATGPAVSLRDCTAASVRDSRATPGTDTFLSVENTDGRLLVDNDLTAATEPVVGDAGFSRSGNRQ